jgi:hypothetical protein
MKPLICGIDFGTTKSGVAVIDGDNKLYVVPNHDYDESSDSLVSWALPTKMMVTTGILNPDDYAYELLQFEEGYGVEYGHIQYRPGIDDVFLSEPLKLVIGTPNPKNFLKKVDISNKETVSKQEDELGDQKLADLSLAQKKIAEQLRPEGLTAIFLRRMVGRIRGKQKSPIHAVIGMPAEFSYAKRKALVYAAHLAHFKKVQLLAEPFAGVLALLDNDKRKIKELANKLALIIDYGGGTCNYAVVVFDSSLAITIQYAGAISRGGEIITQKLVDALTKEELDPIDMAQVRNEANLIKTEFYKSQPIVKRSTEEDSSSDDAEQAHSQSSEVWRNSPVMIRPIYSLVTNRTLKFNPLTNGDCDQLIREEVEIVRNEIKRVLNSDKEEWIDPLDVVFFLGESRRLHCFEKIFWDDWIAKETAGVKSYGLNGNDDLNINPQTVTRGCTLYADRLYAPLKTLPFAIRLSREIELRLVTLQDVPLNYRCRFPNVGEPLLISSGERVPQTRRLRIKLLESTEGFKVQFKSEEHQQNTELETYTFTLAKNTLHKKLPDHAHIDLIYDVRADGLIEIVNCFATIPILRTFLARLKPRKTGKDKEEGDQAAKINAGGIKIPMVWESNLGHFDYQNIESGIRSRYKLSD